MKNIYHSIRSYIRNGVVLPAFAYSGNPAIIVLPSPIFKGNTVFIKKLRRASVILDFGDIWYNPNDFRIYKSLSVYYLKLIFNFADYIVLPTSLMKKFFDNLYSGTTRKHVHIPSAVDTSLIKPLFKSEKPTVAYIGTLNFGRGAEVLPYITRKCLKYIGDCEMIVAGSGNAEKWLKSEIQRLGLQKHMHLLGDVPHFQIAKRCGHAWIGLSLYPGPSIYPVDILKALTYMALGMPVVTTTYIEEANEIAVKTNYDIKSIVDALIYLIKHDDVREELSKRARELAVKKYDIKIIAEKYHQLLSQNL